MGVNAGLLYERIGKFKAQQEREVLAEDERDEPKRLRKENKELRMQKDILQEASVFFAKEM